MLQSAMHSAFERVLLLYVVEHLLYKDFAATTWQLQEPLLLQNFPPQQNAKNTKPGILQCFSPPLHQSEQAQISLREQLPEEI
jgi:hypothetical protein